MVLARSHLIKTGQHFTTQNTISGFPVVQTVKIHLLCGRRRFDTWVGKMPGGGNGSPLQCSCLENPMDRGA